MKKGTLKLPRSGAGGSWILEVRMGDEGGGGGAGWRVGGAVGGWIMGSVWAMPWVGVLCEAAANKSIW